MSSSSQDSTSHQPHPTDDGHAAPGTAAYAGHTAPAERNAEHPEHADDSAHGVHRGHSEHADDSAPGVHRGHSGHAGHSGHSGHAEHAGHNDQHENHPAHDGHGDHSGHSGHGGHAGHAAMFGRLFWIMLAIAVPVVLFSPMFAMLVGYDLPDIAAISWISPVLGTVMYVWGGKPFLSGAVSEIRSRQPGMMLLIALAITVAFVASWGASIGVLDHSLDFWWELALLVVIMLLGHWIEMRSLAQTSSALDSLAALLPDTADRVDGDDIVSVPVDELAAGDVVVVRPGESVPADGTVIEGRAAMNEAMLTGESHTVTRSAGDTVIAGTIATDSGLRVRIDAVGSDTALAGIQRLVSDAQSSSSRAQRLADRAAAWLFWFALGSAVITAIVWSAIGSPDDAVIRTITVLVIACPHALGLAIPLVVSIATERAASAGILIKDRLALESMRRIDTVVFDKTGTLTAGAPEVRRVVALGSGVAEDEILALAAAAERDSEHPLAVAIRGAADDRNLQLGAVSDFTSQPATGVQATVDGHEIRVGGPRLLSETDNETPDFASNAEDEGATILYVLRDGKPIGVLALADAVRPESQQAIDELHQRGIRVVMITGDARAVAKTVAAQVGIDDYYAEVRPEDKSAKVRELQHGPQRVAMVGDGVNDAPALAQADVGIAIGAGTDVAIGSAGIILANDDPRAVVSAIDLSAAAYRKMKQNLWWAAGYNLISVPLAAGVLAGIGFVLPMSVGALLMSASTVVVALNAQLLRRLDLRPSKRDQ